MNHIGCMNDETGVRDLIHVNMPDKQQRPSGKKRKICIRWMEWVMHKYVSFVSLYFMCARLRIWLGCAWFCPGLFDYFMLHAAFWWWRWQRWSPFYMQMLHLLARSGSSIIRCIFDDLERLIEYSDIWQVWELVLISYACLCWHWQLHKWISIDDFWSSVPRLGWSSG